MSSSPPPFPDSYESENLGGHGNDFQRRLALLLLMRATLAERPFRLGIEMRYAAGKFDDVVFLDETSGQWWLIQTKHAMQHNSRLTGEMLFSGSDGDFAVVKYFKSYLRVTECWPYGGKAFKFFLYTNRALDSLVQSSAAKVDKLLEFYGGQSRHVHLAPTAEQMDAILSAINRECDSICFAIVKLFTTKSAEPILAKFKVPLSKLLIKQGKMIVISECFTDQNPDWRVRKFYEMVKSNLEEVNLDIATVSVPVPKEMKDFWTVSSRDKEKDTLLPLVTREIVNQFFADLIVSVSQPNVDEMVEIIDDVGRRWMKSWIRPDIYGMLTRFQTATFDIFRKFFDEWENPLQTQKERRFLRLDDGRDFLATAKKKIDQSLQSLKKHGRFGLDAAENYYVNRRIICPSIYSILKDEEFVDHLFVKSNKRRCFVLIADSGMGKSTLWQHLAFCAQRKYLEAAVFLVYLSELEIEVKDAEHIFDSVLSAENAAILRDSSRKIILFLDALDEVDAERLEAVIKCIEVIVASKKDTKVLISSRARFRGLIEDFFQVESMSLMPFDESEQRDFLYKFWSCQKGINANLLIASDLASDAVERFQCAIPSKNHELIGLPLIMRMYGEIYHDMFINSSKDSQGKTIRTIAGLYRLFTTKGVVMQYKKKHKLCGEETTIIRKFGRQIQADLRRYQLLAVELAINDLLRAGVTDAHFQSELHSFKSDIRDGFEESLLLETVNGEPRFWHRSFAEFLTAQYLLEYVDDCHKQLRKLATDVYSILAKQEEIRKFVLALMDSNPSENHLHVLNRMPLEVVSRWICETNCCNLLREMWKIHDFNQPSEEHVSLSEFMLHTAVEYNALQVVEFLLAASVNIESQDRYDQTPLHIAARSGHIEVAHSLIKHSANIHSQNFNGLYPLDCAALHGHCGIVKLLLDHGATVNLMNNTVRFTPLHFASLKGNRDIVELLVSRGGNVNAVGLKGFTPLLLAAERRNQAAMEALISAGANINSVDNRDRNTSLFYAVQKKFNEIVELLIAKGADVEMTNADGNTALHFAAWKGYHAIVKSLIAGGANCTVKGKKGRTPLHLAAWNGHLEAVKLMILKDFKDEKKTRVSASRRRSDKPLLFFLNMMGINLPEERTEIKPPELKRIPKMKKVDVNVTDDEGYTALHFAAQHGHSDIVQYLLSQGANVSVEGKKGRTPLHLVARWTRPKDDMWILEDDGTEQSVYRMEHKDIVESLLARGADINLVDEDGCSPLHSATWNGYSDTIELLISKGANVLAADKNGRTPLHMLAWRGHTESVELLITKGVDVNSVDHDERTPLHSATWSGHLEVVRLLISKGACVTAVDQKGRSPLHLAAWNGHKDIVELLIMKGADITACTYEGRTLLQSAAWHGHTDMVELLIAKGAQVDAVGKNGRTPLHLAAWNGHRETVELLILAGANVKLVSDDDRTALHSAASHGHKNTLKVLISSGAEVDSVDSKGKSPLHLAASSGHKDSVQLLIAKGANINVVDVDGDTSLRAAVWYGFEDIVNLLTSKGAKNSDVGNQRTTPLHLAVSKGQKSSVEFLINKGAAVDAVDQSGSTPLHLAAYAMHQDIVELLISRGADVNAVGVKGRTPLHLVAWHGHKKPVELILQKGSTDVNRVDDDGNIPLHCAALRGHNDIAKMLIRRDATIDAVGEKGRTPLQLAAWNGHVELVKLLIVWGANVNSAGQKGSTPLHSAAWNGNKNIVEFLIKNGANVNSLDEKKRTPLHLAALRGHESSVRFLIAKGAKINSIDNIGKTPLDLAVSAKHKDIIKLLILKGVNVNSTYIEQLGV